jgi:hypothetical protein
MSTTLETVGQELIIRVRLESYREFTRYNKWSHRRETQTCVSMSPLDGGDAWFVTFTGWQTAFAHAVRNILENGNGERDVTVLCRFKRRQEYNGKPQIAVTHCKIQ